MEKLLGAIQVCSAVARRDTRALQSPLDDENISGLLIALQQVLSLALIPGESFFRFVLTASKNIPTAPEIHELLKEVTSNAAYASLPTVTKERVYLVLSLSVPGSLMRTAQRCFRQIETVSAFYSREAPFFSDYFVTDKLTPALMAVARIRFDLGPFNLSMLKFFDEPTNSLPPPAAAALASSSPPSQNVISEERRLCEVTSSASTSNVGPVDEDQAGVGQAAPPTIKKKKKAKLICNTGVQCDLPSEERSARRFREAEAQICPETRFASTQCVHIIESNSGVCGVVPSTSTDEECDPAWNDKLLQSASTHELNAWEQALMAREATLAAKERLADFREAALDRKLRSVEAMTRATQERNGNRSPSPSVDDDGESSQACAPMFGKRALSSVIRSLSRAPANHHQNHAAEPTTSSQASSWGIDPEAASTAPDDFRQIRDHAREAPLAAITDVVIDDLASNTTAAIRAAEQSWRCADCGMELYLPPSSGTQTPTPARSNSDNQSLLTTAVAMLTSKLGSTRSSESASMIPGRSSQRLKTPSRSTDEPQLCSYTGKVFCGVCMEPNQTHIIPAKIVMSWDISPYPVSNFAFSFLRSICDDPIFTVKTLEHTLEISPRLQAAHGIRRQLRILVSVSERCEAAKEAFMAIHHSRYCGLSELYSINDLVALHEASHPPVHAESGGPADVSYRQKKQVLNLLSALKRMRDELAMHVVKQCAICRERCIGHCPLCADQRPLYSFDIQKVVICDECGALYHQPCFAANGSCVKHQR